MIVTTTITPNGAAYLLSMQWQRFNGENTTVETIAPSREEAQYRAIVEHRQHVLFALDEFMNATAPGPETHPKAAHIWHRLAELSRKMEQGQQTHFQLCERILDNARFYTAIMPKNNYSEAMARWRYVLNIIETELNNKEAKRWMYNLEPQ